MEKESSDKKPIAIIPARINSSRLPGKALVDIHGIPMVIHVLKRVQMCPEISDTYVATDSKEIESIVREHGGKTIMTSSNHINGTERVCEAIEKLNGDTFVIIFGDEAMLNPEHIKESINTYENFDCDMSILATKFYKDNSPADIKIVLNNKNEIMYISRSDIPSGNRIKPDYRLKACHIMTVSRNLLESYKLLPMSNIEKCESNEYIRLIENGFKIKCSLVENAVISIDLPSDLEYIKKIILNDPIYLKYK